MSSMHRAGFAKNRDKNEPEIVDALEAVGAVVDRLNQKGLPDLLVGFRGETFLLEVKTAKGKLTPDQVTWWKRWCGSCGQCHIVRTVEEALAAIRVQVVQPGMWRDTDGTLRTYPRPRG